jgi:hypothetical protein
MDKLIQLERMYPSANIITRKTISDLYVKINKTKEDTIIFDFKNIDFMSRSCADEYVKQKKISKKKISEINQTADIQKMFAAVKKTQNYIPNIRLDKMPQVVTV